MVHETAMHLGLTAHTEGEKIVKKKPGDRCCSVSCWGLMIWSINFIFQSEPEGYQVIAPEGFVFKEVLRVQRLNFKRYGWMIRTYLRNRCSYFFHPFVKVVTKVQKFCLFFAMFMKQVHYIYIYSCRYI